MITRIIGVLVVAVLAAGIETRDSHAECAAEAYMYGHMIGPVTVDDIATDGKVITLKGVQYWPPLPRYDPDSKRIVPSERGKRRGELRQRARALDRALSEQGEDYNVRRMAIAEFLQSSPLVSSTFVDTSFGGNVVFVNWVDIGKELFHVPKEYVERPSHAELLSNALRSLQRSVERCDMLIIRAGGGPSMSLRLAGSTSNTSKRSQQPSRGTMTAYCSISVWLSNSRIPSTSSQRRSGSAN